MKIIPFKTPPDYFREILNSKYSNINSFFELYQNFDNYGDDTDLHIYPYVTAQPGLLSVGCDKKCSFCPTFKLHKGNITNGDIDIIIPKYKDMSIHWMDENFFANDMTKILPLLKQYNIKSLVMSTASTINEVFDKFGEQYLYDCGIVAIETGLENVTLYNKVKLLTINPKLITMLYLNMSLFPKETKETLQANSQYMMDKTPNNLIHHYNFNWYSPGQYFYDYGVPTKDMISIEGNIARVLPTNLPTSLSNQSIQFTNIKLSNYYNRLINKISISPDLRFDGSIIEFVKLDVYNILNNTLLTEQEKLAYVVTGIRSLTIK